MVLNYMGAAAINAVAALLSIPVIAAGIWLSTQADNACVQILQWPLIGLGVAVLAVGLAGFIGAFWRLPWLLLAYMVLMVLLVAALACLAVFVFVATTGTSGRPVPSRAFLEYDLADYSGWLRRRVADEPGRWDEIKTCLAATAPVCSELNQTYAAPQDFFAAWLTPMQILQWPLIGLGVAVLAVGLAGFIGAFWRLPWLLLAYMVLMVLLVAALACLAVFVFVATTGTSGRPVPSRAFLEYDLADYSGWLRRRVADEPGRWDEIKTCLAATAPVCSELNQTYAAPQDFFAAWLTPMQSGCCKPPTRCGYTFVSATFWISPIDGAADPDCAAWSNDQDRLCYSCDSCKAGLLQNLRREWRRADVILAVTVVALLAVYVMGCYAFRTARTDELFRRYRQGYT